MKILQTRLKSLRADSVDDGLFRPSHPAEPRRIPRIEQTINGYLDEMHMHMINLLEDLGLHHIPPARLSSEANSQPGPNSIDHRRRHRESKNQRCGIIEVGVPGALTEP